MDAKFSSSFAGNHLVNMGFEYMKVVIWALVSEIIGAIAVIVSLVYVGKGIRQNIGVSSVANHQMLVE